MPEIDEAVPQVLAGASAAILAIDPQRRQVVHANAAAIELTGDRVRPPVDIDEWGDAAHRVLRPGSILLLYTDGLTDIAGEDADERTTLLEDTFAAVKPASDPDDVVEQLP